MMKKGNNKIIILIIDILILGFCIFGILQIKEKAGLPLKITHTPNGLFVSEIFEKKYNDYFLLNDKIIAIEGKRVSTIESVEFVLDGKGIGETIALRIENAGLIRLELVPTSTFYTTRYVIIVTLIGLLFFIIGVLVYLKKPEDKAALVFHWTTIGVALLIMTTWGKYTMEPFGSGIAVRFIFNMAYALLPLLFLHFTVVFPVDKFSGKKTIFGILYAVSGLLIVWMNVTFIVAALQESVEWFARYLTSFTSTRLYFIACVIAALSNLIYTYRHYANLSDRKKIRWILFGLIVGILPFILLWVIPQMVISRGIIDEEFIILFASVIPLTFAISIVKYKILDIDVLINRSIVYTMIMLLLLGFYATFLSLSILLIGFLTPQASIITSIGVVVLFVFIFEPIRTAIQKFVDKLFYRNQYHFRKSIHQIFEEIKNSLSIMDLANILVNKIDSLIPVRKIGFLTVDPVSQQLQAIAGKNFEGQGQNNRLQNRFEVFQNLDLPFTKPFNIEAGIGFNDISKLNLMNIDTELVFLLSNRDKKVIGFLGIGKKKSDTRFTSEDIELLESFASQASVVLERLRLQEKLILEQTEKERLNELNQLKSFFVSTVSHDLKTPLTSIKVFAELLTSKGSFKSVKDREYVEIIEGEADRLTRLINNVLDFAKIERGIKEYHFEHVNITGIIKKVLDILEYQFKMGKFNVVIEIPEKEIFINADADSIIEAIINIITNAMKYSSSSRKIQIVLLEENDSVLLKIIDWGYGIAKDKLDNIFEPFTRSVSSGAKIEGAGLGLAIVKHIMDAHKGKIYVESELGKGSEFTLVFPKTI